MDKFNNRYRIPSARATFWNYANNAPYFVTICTKHRECFFGHIVETQYFASPFTTTKNIPSILTETQNIPPILTETQNIASLREMKLSAIGEIAHTCWLEIPEHFPYVKLGEFVVMPDHVHGIIIIDKPEEKPAAEKNQLSQINQFGPQSKNLASIVRGYKVGVTKNARLLNPNFDWQTRYHDHIIRTEASYNSISAYIINNPRNYNSHKRIN
jgi:REP element-mobilizing transposase RayT